MSLTTPEWRAVSPDGASIDALWDADQHDNLTITTIGHRDGSADLHLTGVLDLATTALLGAAVRAMVASGRRDVRLDLGRLSFCDCTGIGALVEARQSVVDADGSLTLRNVTTQLRKTMELLQLRALLADTSTDRA